MSLLLALDIGTKKTGAALGDTDSGFIIALDTIHHTSIDELVTRICEIVRQRKVSEIVVGLPLLLRGEEGLQAKLTRSVSEHVKERSRLPVRFVDERFTSLGSKKGKHDDAKAACEILSAALGSQKSDN